MLESAMKKDIFGLSKFVMDNERENTGVGELVQGSTSKLGGGIRSFDRAR
jgi:hypothetical protein